MKKSLLALIALSLIVFAGCTKTPAPEQNAEQAVTTEAPQADAPAVDAAPNADEAPQGDEAPAEEGATEENGEAN